MKKRIKSFSGILKGIICLMTKSKLSRVDMLIDSLSRFKNSAEASDEEKKGIFHVTKMHEILMNRYPDGYSEATATEAVRNVIQRYGTNSDGTICKQNTGGPLYFRRVESGKNGLWKLLDDESDLDVEFGTDNDIDEIDFDMNETDLKFNNELKIKRLENQNKHVDISGGYLYIITNPAWPKWIKVGMAMNVLARLRMYQTYSPLRDYQLVFHSEFMENRRETERLAHRALKRAKLGQKGEWFESPVPGAISILNSAGITAKPPKKCQK